jgi:SAM-dependent methyltransferase
VTHADEPTVRELGGALATRAARRATSRFFLWLRYRVRGRRHRRLVQERLDGVPLLVFPEVFNPVLFRTGAILARAVSEVYGHGRGGGTRALDMGTGSGAGALFAAFEGFDVVAVDVNPAAVRCARTNALLNRLEAHIDVREGDLFEPVQGERFDLVLFNPPFFRGPPQDALDQAWRSPDVMERFAAGLPGHLTPGRPHGSSTASGSGAGRLGADRPVHGRRAQGDARRASPCRDAHRRRVEPGPRKRGGHGVLGQGRRRLSEQRRRVGVGLVTRAR